MKRRTKAAVLTGALVGVLAVGSVTAYLTDADAAASTFTVGSVSLDLQEPSFVPANARNITPKQVIAQDPQVKNDGSNAEYVFMTVKIPYRSIVTANEDGTKNAAAAMPLFSYTADSAWTLLDTSTDEENHVQTRRYVYGTAESCTALEPGSVTSKLYTTLTTAAFVEEQGLENTSGTVEITAYGIQTDNLGVAGTTDPDQVWSIVANQIPDSEKTGEDPDTDIVIS